MRTFLFFSFFASIIACSDSSKQNLEEKSDIKALPYIGNMDIVNKEENGQVITDTIYDRIPLFHYINQDSLPVSNDPSTKLSAFAVVIFTIKLVKRIKNEKLIFILFSLNLSFRHI